MEMIRDTLYGDARAKLEALEKNEDKAMRAVEERATERIVAAEFDHYEGNRHERRKTAAIKQKIKKFEAALKG